jgi:hypothetical protein
VACGGVLLALAPAAAARESAATRLHGSDAPVTLAAAADAYVDASRPRASYGTSAVMRAASSPLRRAFVRFSLPTRVASGQRARLSLLVTQGSSSGFEVRAAPATRWSETRIHWSGAPAIATTAAAVPSGAVRSGTWTTVDVSTLVAGAGAGELTLALTSRSAVAFATRESGSAPRLVIEAAPPVAPPPTAAGSRFGLATGGVIEWASDADLARQLDGYRTIGAGWIRFDVKWAAVEQTRGSFDWRIYDRLVAAASARGLRAVATLAYTPDWARPAGTDDKHPPTSPADYARFARAVVTRYAPLGVKHYEIWNEPNIDGFWKPAPDPARYTQLLKAAYAEMKQAEASITVLAGAFSPAGGYHEPSCGGGPTPNVNAVDFLERMYANGARGSFDAIAHHPYGNPADTHRCAAWNQMAGTPTSLRSLMVANGDSGKKIWATEFGSEANRIGEQTQADQLGAAMRLWLTYPWAGELMVYSYKQALEGFNLVRPDWSPRPAWYAFQSAPKR